MICNMNNMSGSSAANMLFVASCILTALVIVARPSTSSPSAQSSPAASAASLSPYMRGTSLHSNIDRRILDSVKISDVCTGLPKKDCKDHPLCKYKKSGSYCYSKPVRKSSGKLKTQDEVLDDSNVLPGNANSTTALPETSAKPVKYWSRSMDGAHECVYSSLYPNSYLHSQPVILFDTYEECCSAFREVYPDAQVCVQESVSLFEAVEPATNTSIPEDLDTETNTTAEEQSPANTTYTSSQGTNASEGEKSFTEDTSQVQEYPEFLPLEPNGVLSDLPWDFGSPPQWQIDPNMSVSPIDHHPILEWDAHWLEEPYNTERVSFTDHSITNIPAVGLGSYSDLTLKISVPEWASLRCLAHIDTAMPFENFSLIVNGMRRRQWFHGGDDSRYDGWVEILTGFHKGDVTIVFRVQNTDHYAHFDRNGGYGDYGTGHVWLDQCQIVSHMELDV